MVRIEILSFGDPAERMYGVAGEEIPVFKFSIRSVKTSALLIRGKFAAAGLTRAHNTKETRRTLPATKQRISLGPF